MLDKVQSLSMKTDRLMSVAATIVMLMAIVANVRKAADVMLHLGRPGVWWQSWDAILAAVALEAGFALFAFFLAAEIRGRRRHLGQLAAGTIVLGTLSAVANVAYYTTYSPAGVFTWQWWQSVVLGLSAPTVAIATALLAGIVEGIRTAEATNQAEQEQLAREQELAIEKQHTAQARAAARQAKAEAGKVPAVSGKLPAYSGNGRMTPEKLLAEFPDALGWTGKQVAGVAGVTERTGRNWLKRMKEMTE